MNKIKEMTNQEYKQLKLNKLENEQVLSFIKTIRDSFVGSEIVYTQGSCYQFFKILQSVFPNAIAYYDCDHVITRIGNYFYDITGEVEIGRHLMMDEHYKVNEVYKCKFNIGNYGL